MNPMDFFTQNSFFPFNTNSTSTFTPKKIYEMKKMLNQYQSLLNDEFFEEIQNLSTENTKSVQLVPIEIWENNKNIFVSIVAPGLTKLKNAKISFNNNQVLTLHLKLHSIKPTSAESLITSELPQQSFEREIFLEKAVITSDFSSSYNNGVLTYTFEKAQDTLDSSINF